MPATQWIDIAAVALVFGLLMKYVDLPSLMIWALFVVIIISIRIDIHDRYNSVALTNDNVDTWFNWFLLGATLYGAMWSATALLLVPSEIPVAAAFTALVLCGLTAAGVAVSSVNLKAFIVYAMATLWPYSFYLIASGQNPQSAIGALAFLFSFVVFIMGLRTHNFFSNMVNLELKYDYLEKELQYEIRKRNLAESALLDNTLEEELAEMIRQQSLALKEGSMAVDRTPDGSLPDPSAYLELLDSKIKAQLQNTLVFVRDLESAKLPENLKKEVQIIEKILNNISMAINKITMNNEDVRQTILELDLDDDDYKPLNLRRIINYLVQAVPLVYKAKYITINKDIDKHIPSVIYGNSKALKKILSNLITNAVKYSDGGKVDIRIEVVDDDSAPEKIGLRFMIADTGIGMPKEAIEFLESEQTEGVEKYPGLAVVKHLLARHGNRLSVKSTLSVGTDIEFYMQFRTENAAIA